MSKRLPPNIGLEVGKPLLYNPYQQEFLRARRMRFCRQCSKIGFTGTDGLFRCPSCGQLQIDAPRVFKRLGCFAGRRGGKSVVGAHGAREEVLVPNSLGWICGPSYKILHDATMPTFLKLIPREWCANWDQDHLELTLVNGAQVQFRSLDDPDRGHAGVGLHWVWLDEAAFIQELAWDYLRPALTDFGGAAFFTSSVDGFDWTYERIEKKALVDKTPGFWAAKWRTIDNPKIATEHPEEIEEARLSMTPQIFRQEYEAARENFTGSVYGEWMDDAVLMDDAAVQEFIPEWPAIDPSRRVIIGLDSGADHPFGAVGHVVTERGIVVVGDYLERQRAFATHLSEIKRVIPLGDQPLWTANRNEAQLRAEFNAPPNNILVALAENDQMAGIQRVLSWLYTKQLKFAHTVPRTIDQMRKLRYATSNTGTDGQKSNTEKVFKLRDELPDCVRYALMTWPEMPKILALLNKRVVTARVQWELDKIKAFEAKKDDRDLQPLSENYPTGDFWGVAEEAFSLN